MVSTFPFHKRREFALGQRLRYRCSFSHIHCRNPLIVVKKTARKTASKPAAIDFETALKELETLVERMETGDQPLETALKDFERGVELFRICQGALKDAEQKVQILLEKSGQAKLANFDADE